LPDDINKNPAIAIVGMRCIEAIKTTPVIRIAVIPVLEKRVTLPAGPVAGAGGQLKACFELMVST